MPFPLLLSTQAPNYYRRATDSVSCVWLPSVTLVAACILLQRPWLVVQWSVPWKRNTGDRKIKARQEDDRDADVVCIQSSWLASHSHLITKRMCSQLPQRPYWTKHVPADCSRVGYRGYYYPRGRWTEVDGHSDCEALR